MAQNKANKKVNWIENVTHLVKEGKGQKVSLALIKKKLCDEYMIDMSLTRNKNKLKDALKQCIDEKKIKKVDGSFAPYEEVKTPVKKKPKEKKKPTKKGKVIPREGKWLKLYVKTKEKAKSNQSTCKACDEPIEKGAMRFQVIDNSLLRMCARYDLQAKGSDDGLYAEGPLLDGKSISRKIFFIHENCLDAANEKFEKIFQNEWERARPQIIAEIHNMEDLE